MKERAFVKNKKIDLLYFVGLMLTTLLIGRLSLGQGFDFDVYSSFAGDGTFGAMLVKSIQEYGPMGVWFNPRLGAPETMIMIDYPVLGNVMVWLLWVISLFVKSTPKILYLYLIISFALDGLSMSLLLRKLEINRLTSYVISVLFAIAPFHFYRYISHSSLINYMFVPLAIYLSLVILDYFPNEKKWKIIIAIVLLGLGYGYYYAFGLILMGVALIVRFIQLDDKKKIIKKCFIIIGLLAVIFLTLLPRIIYSFIYGNNSEVGVRMFYEQELYGLKIINLVLPVSYSRIGFLKNITMTYINSAPLVTENQGASLGIIGTLGFIILCIAFFVLFSKKNISIFDSKEKNLIDFLIIEALTLVLVGTVGGFGEIFNWTVTSQIRCYNRSSIILTALSLIMIAVLLNKLSCQKEKVAVIVCLLTLGIGCYDQIYIYDKDWQSKEGLQSAQSMYENYFKSVEDNFEKNAMVYQLPCLKFPEAGAINGVSDYKHFIGYLFTDNLRWSYGAVRGRNTQYVELNIDDGMSYRFVKELQKKGFSAVYIDVDGYADGGSQIIGFYDSLGISPIISDDGKLYTYDIRNVE